MKKLRSLPSLTHIIPDILLMALAIGVTFVLHDSYEVAIANSTKILVFSLILISLRVIMFWAFGVYYSIWRYISTHDAITLTSASFFSSSVFLAAFLFFSDSPPWEVIITEFFTSTFLLLSMRITRRVQVEAQKKYRNQGAIKTIIYGAGYGGQTLAKRFQGDDGLNTDLVGFIDDDKEKHNRVIGGVKVLGGLESLKEVLIKYEIQQVIIFLPKNVGPKIREIVEICKPFHIKPKITTSLQSVSFDNNGSLQTFREVNLNDLLNRKSSDIDTNSISKLFKDKRVLVTGAGGSIGSEISRQVLRFNPAKLILLDHSELNLYQIDRELRMDNHQSLKVIPVLMDLKSEEGVKHIMKEHLPDVVLHAAAYKHVHLVENNPYSSILNNVHGTQNLLEQSIQANVETFVLISTDKAVNPAGIMGATKRVCEILVTIAGNKTKKRYCSVRFGNVLGSSGSLIPLIEKQIRAGESVTVTHADMTRYFMLTSEAVSLVLTAGTFARPGDVNILKMGEPVKILDIAKNLISILSPPDREIPIIFTGLRPGEKMFEELYLTGNELKTEHPDILTIPDGDNLNDLINNEDDILKKINQMVKFARENNTESLYILNELVKSTYIPPESTNSYKLFLSKRDH